MKFNKNSNLLLLNNKGELFVLRNDFQEKKKINKIKTEEGFCTYFEWYPFNDNDFSYSTEKNKIFYYSLSNIDKNNNSKNDNKNKTKEKYIHIKDDENFSISTMEFYDLDENYKYLLVGTTNSKIYLLDFINYEITNKFVKYGKTPIQYLFWLNNQPGSFISLNENIGRYIKWNVSRENYILIGKFSDFNLTSCVKYDNDSNFLITNGNGEVSIVNLINNKIAFLIKDRHYQCIYDLKINPNNDDLFITASFDGNIKLYSIKNKYSLVYSFNTNNNLNNIKTLSSNEENNTSITKLSYNLNFNKKIDVFAPTIILSFSFQSNPLIINFFLLSF
jgi:WD40 repeat protein